MLIFFKEKLAYLANPKTGTTAVEMALRRRADIVFARRRKHINAQKFHTKIAPFLQDSFGTQVETLAVMRDPIEQIRSWYRYRSGPRQTGTPKGTNGCSFDDFVRAVIAENPPQFAAIGSQFRFLTAPDGTLRVDHVFAYENQTGFRSFLETRLGADLELKVKNISPPADAPLSAQVEAALRAARADEFAFYDRLQRANGYLHKGL